MGIFIQNMGPTDANVTSDPQGEHNYKVCINEKTICFFKHARLHGLAACLEAASKAVKEDHLTTMLNLYEQTNRKRK